MDQVKIEYVLKPIDSIYRFYPTSGDTGSNLVEWIRFLIGKDMQFPHIKVIIPTAPTQPYTPLEGEVIEMQIRSFFIHKRLTF